MMAKSDDHFAGGRLMEDGRSRGHDVSRRAAIGSVAGLAIMSSTQGRATRVADQRTALPATGVHDAIRPEQHGAIGDGMVDDTAALQAAFDTGLSVQLMAGRRYLVTRALRLSASGVAVTGGGEIRVSPKFDLLSDADGNGTHMRVLFVTGANVSLIGIKFDATDAPVGTAVENGVIWSRAPFTTIRDCSFVGNRKGTCIWGLGDAPYLTVLGCQFNACSGAVFVKGRNTIIGENIIIDATDAAIAINGRTCVGAVIANNSISNERLIAIPSMIAVEEGASQWAITGNTLIGVNGGGIICTNILDSVKVKGGVISSNIVSALRFDGTVPHGRNPAALLSISDSYLDWIVHDNIFTACPTGNVNSRLIIVSSSGGTLHHNIIDASIVSDISAAVEISAGGGGLSIKENKSYVPPHGRHYIFGPGDYHDEPCRFVGGELHGGEEGIDLEVHKNRIVNLMPEIRNIEFSSTKILVNALSLLGDRCIFLDEGAKYRDHKIGKFTEMYCQNVPLKSGIIPFQEGDRFHFISVASDNSIGVMRTATGWKRF